MTTTQTLRFTLPGVWARIDLSTEAASRASIRKMLEQATNRRDDLAPMRAELRSRLQQAADSARENGAVDMRIARELAKGIPLPAWAILFEPTVDQEDFAALGLDELKSVLDAGTRTNVPVDSTQFDPTVADGEKIAVVRQSWRRTTHVAEGNVERDFDFLEADYWLAAGNPNRIALLTFSTAYVQHEEQMLRLFDAVVSTIRWESPEHVADAQIG